MPKSLVQCLPPGECSAKQQLNKNGIPEGHKQHTHPQSGHLFLLPTTNPCPIYSIIETSRVWKTVKQSAFNCCCWGVVLNQHLPL